MNSTRDKYLVDHELFTECIHKFSKIAKKELAVGSLFEYVANPIDLKDLVSKFSCSSVLISIAKDNTF